MRYIYADVIRDGNGIICAGATVTVYLAGTTTLANVYAASAGGAHINSVTTGSDGSFSFYVDTADYGVQNFKIVASLSGFTAMTLDNIVIAGLYGGAASGYATLNGSSLVVQEPASKAQASGVASLDAGSLVVQNPTNATATPTATKIPIADGSGKLAAGWGGSASTLATLDANIRVVQPANTIYDGVGNRSASPTPAANTVPVRNATGDIGGGPGVIGEASATSASSPVTLDLGTVTAGDRVFVSGTYVGTVPQNVYVYVEIAKSSGTATIVFQNSQPAIESYFGNPVASFPSPSRLTVTGIMQITGSGTLVINSSYGAAGGSPTLTAMQIYAFFLKKQ